MGAGKMVTALLMLALAAEVTQAEVDAYLAKSAESRPIALAEAKTRMATVRKDRHLPKYVQRRNLKAAGDALRRLNAPGPWYAPMPSDLCYPEPGMIGSIDQPMLVKAVVDTDNAIVEAYMIADRLDQYDFSVLGPPYKSHTRLYWYCGSTDGFREGREANVTGVFKVDGTKEVPTTLSTEPIFILRRISDEMLGVSEKRGGTK